MSTENYISEIRKKLGRAPFIHPAARIIIENDQQEILFITRIDNGKIGLPAGGLEWNETIEECIRREVLEETGLEVLELEVIGISSDPQNESVAYPNGDKIQYFTIEFYCNKWKGILRADQVETKAVAFQSPDFKNQLPENERSTFESLEYFRKSGKVRLR